MTKVYGFPMYILDNKIRILKASLKILNKTLFGNVRTKVLEAEKKLIDIQIEIDSLGQNDLLQAKDLKAQSDLEVNLNLEEEFWKEKFRLNKQNFGI